MTRRSWRPLLIPFGFALSQYLLTIPVWFDKEMNLDSKYIGVGLTSECALLILVPLTLPMVAISLSDTKFSWWKYYLAFLLPSLPNLVWQIVPTTSLMNGILRESLGSSLADNIGRTPLVALSNAFIYLGLYGVIALSALPAVRAGPVPAAVMGLLGAAVLFWILPK